VKAVLPNSSKVRTQELTARRNSIFQTLLVLAFMLVIAGPVRAQQAPPATPPGSAAQPPSSQDAPKKPDQPQDKKPAAAPDARPMTPEEARQAQIVADTEKLYQLAQELQAEVAKSSKNTLSLAVIKKAEEVEKLAKSLKERMKPE
jgi:hypothetical protein